MKEIKNISITELYAHPDNPRRNVGDVSELADSIRLSGILQNLTVVRGHILSAPEYIRLRGIDAAEALREYNNLKREDGNGIYPDGLRSEEGYTVIIGHRRLAAAKLAGLKELPCIICDMSYSEQVSTMLCENMQRSDLTVLEEADGIQLMLDLGETVESVSEKTGLSKSTIRRRRSLCALDRDKLTAALERSPRLEDYIELERITDSEKRNEVLDSIGTQNYRYTLNSVLNEQETERAMAEAREYLLTFATETDKPTSEMRYCTFRDMDKVREFEPESGKEYFFITRYKCFDIYVKKSEEDIKREDAMNEARRKEAAAERERDARVDTILGNMRKSRRDFLRDFAITAARGKAVDACILRAIALMADSGTFSDIVGILPNEDGEIEVEDIINGKFDYPLKKAVLAAAYSTIDDGVERVLDWRGDFCGSVTLCREYDFLELLGYQTSDEERAMLEGTHEVYGGQQEDE